MEAQMLKCEMCLGRVLRGDMAVLRSVDRSIEYEAGTAIEITENTHKINVKIDGITVKINPNGCLSVDIPNIYAVTAILETLSRYPLDHNYRDLRPLVPNGVNQGKWATETVGANNKPIYLNQGVITASNSTIGANNKPIYMNDGVITPSNADIGANNNPVYMNNGVITPSNASIGAANKPIHVENGIIKASGANVGSSTQPVYMDSGVVTQCGNSLDVSITGNAPKDALAQKIDETYIKGISIASDGTITVTRGDGHTDTYDTLKDLVDAIDTALDDLLTDVAQNYVKRTPTDISSNPMIFVNGNIVYLKIESNYYYSNRIEYYYKEGPGNYQKVNFVAFPCANESYDSNKTYYKFNSQTADYEYYNASATTWLTNRNECYYIYDSSRSKTFEEENNETNNFQNPPVTGKLYQRTVTGSGGTWYSNNEYPDGMPHTGVMTARSRHNTHLFIYDVSTELGFNTLIAQVDGRDVYGQGYCSTAVMVIKGHRYRVEGYERVVIGFFGD